MKEMLPEGAVRQKMKTDGFNDSEISDFLAGKTIVIPSAQELEDRQYQAISVSKLNISSPSSPAATTPVPARPAKRLSVLDEIQLGPKLKPVNPDDKRQKPKAEVKAVGLLGTLAAAMSERRFHIKNQADEDDDSDGSGWSDTDSD